MSQWLPEWLDFLPHDETPNWHIWNALFCRSSLCPYFFYGYFVWISKFQLCWEGGRDCWGVRNARVHTGIFKMYNQQGPTVYHIELYSVLCNSLDGREVWGRMVICICMAESPHISPETVTTLLIGYTTMQNKKKFLRIIFSSVQLLSHVRLFVTPWTAARQASLSITISRSSLKLTSIELVMPSSHLILCRPLFLLPPMPPSIRVFSNESALCMRWPKYWSFSFSIIPSKEHPGLISFKMDWLDLFAVQGTLKSLLQHHS